jgi:transketolase
MRNAFIEELVHAASVNEKIALVVGDLGYGVVEPFAKQFPKRFFNAGVAEQNMMGLSAGLASEGFHVFVYSIANFPTFRCAEQIRNDVDYHELSVTIVAVGGGLTYGNLGYSHHAIQDYGLMRMMPNMVIASPGDPMEVRACVRYLIDNPQPSYLRLGKAGEQCFHKEIPSVSPGKWLKVIDLKDNKGTLLTTGAPLAYAMQWLESPSHRGFSLHSMPLWGMSSKSLQSNQVERWGLVVTLEDHIADCGFGSWLRESLEPTPFLMNRVIVKALDSKIAGLVGSQAALNELGGISGPNVKLNVSVR